MAELAASAQISVYPLRQEHLTPAIEAVTDALRARGLRAEVGPMSTRVAGTADLVFAALQEAFVKAAASGEVVMTITISNACPVPDSAR